MQKRFALTIVAALCILVLPSLGVAEGRSTPVNWETTGTMLLDRGEIRCPGHGEPSPGPMPPWCPSDSYTVVRNRTLQCQIVWSTDIRIGGFSTEVLNFIVDPSFSGPAWGTMRIDVPSGGSWEGYFTGKYSGPGAATVRLVLLGTGPFLGMRLKAEGIGSVGPTGPKVTWVGQIKGKPRRAR